MTDLQEWRYRNTPETFHTRYLVTGSGCWEWQRCRNGQGYGLMCWRGRVMGAHRVAWLLTYGALPPGHLNLDHLCRNRACVNPEHLEAVTPTENKRRGDHSRQGIRQRQKTACKHGHAYTDENTRYMRGGDGYLSRVCRTCLREYDRRRRAK